MTFAIPPTQLIQIDIEAREIGKNYPVAVPLLGDARAGLATCSRRSGPGEPADRYGDEIDRLRRGLAASRSRSSRAPTRRP